jgi:NifB/MoaA-like Fe-S oxidoreductase
MKDAAFYGNFEQIENGIGLTAKFLTEAFESLNALSQNFALKKPKKSLLISGVSGAKANAKLIKACNEKIGGLTAEILAVENEFFGKTVTCTGLLTGEDIANAVKEYQKAGGVFDEILLPSSVLKEFEEVFLCGMTLQGLKDRLRFENIRINQECGYGLIDILAKEKE